MTAAEDLPVPTTRAEAVIDLDAIAHNVAALRAHVGGRDLMAVVKADGYGHGIVQAARAAREGGAGWLGVAFLSEALALRYAGDTGPILSWLAVPGERYDEGLAAGVDVSAYTTAQLHQIAAAAARAGAVARVQLKLDTGLGRGGARAADWRQVVTDAARLERAGSILVSGIWSHLACSDEPGHPANARQLAAFRTGLDIVAASGLEPEHVHLANSGGTLALPSCWFTMVRPGIAVYGVSPFADGTSPVGLRPAMTLRARLALVKGVDAGHGVSYGLTYETERDTTLALVPLGYGDGIPRHASSRGPVQVDRRRFQVAGRICMDQFVVDLGGPRTGIQAGDEVVVFGPGDRGEPTVRDWAVAADTIGYEVVTRIGSRVPRRYVHGPERGV